MLRRLGEALVVLPPLLLLGHCTMDFFAVDQCLDAGHVYDYAQGICRGDVEHLPYIPYIERAKWLLVLAVGCLVTGTLMLWTNRRGS
jgi:hypothetical protein